MKYKVIIKEKGIRLLRSRIYSLLINRGIYIPNEIVSIPSDFSGVSKYTEGLTDDEIMKRFHLICEYISIVINTTKKLDIDKKNYTELNIRSINYILDLLLDNSLGDDNLLEGWDNINNTINDDILSHCKAAIKSSPELDLSTKFYINNRFKLVKKLLSIEKEGIFDDIFLIPLFLKDSIEVLDVSLKDLLRAFKILQKRDTFHSGEMRDICILDFVNECVENDRGAIEVSIIIDTIEFILDKLLKKYTLVEIARYLVSNLRKDTFISPKDLLDEKVFNYYIECNNDLTLSEPIKTLFKLVKGHKKLSNNLKERILLMPERYLYFKKEISDLINDPGDLLPTALEEIISSSEVYNITNLVKAHYSDSLSPDNFVRFYTDGIGILRKRTIQINPSNILLRDIIKNKIISYIVKRGEENKTKKSNAIILLDIPQQHPLYVNYRDLYNKFIITFKVSLLKGEKYTQEEGNYVLNYRERGSEEAFSDTLVFEKTEKVNLFKKVVGSSSIDGKFSNWLAVNYLTKVDPYYITLYQAAQLYYKAAGYKVITKKVIESGDYKNYSILTINKKKHYYRFLREIIGMENI